MDRIEFFNAESGMPVSFYCIEETCLGEERYLLVSDKDPEEEGANAYIFRVVGEDDTDFTYEEVEDEQTLNAVAALFAELLDDVALV